MLDPRPEKGLVVGGVAMEVEITVFLDSLYGLRVLLNDDEGEGLGRELLADEGAHSPEAADDVVVFQGLYLFFHLFPPDDALKLPLEHDLGETPDDVAEDAHAEDDEEHGEDL